MNIFKNDLMVLNRIERNVDGIGIDLSRSIVKDSLVSGLLTTQPRSRPDSATLLTFVLQFAVIYLPFRKELFKTVALSPIDLLISLSLGTVAFWGEEIVKRIIRQRK